MACPLVEQGLSRRNRAGSANGWSEYGGLPVQSRLCRDKQWVTEAPSICNPCSRSCRTLVASKDLVGRGIPAEPRPAVNSRLGRDASPYLSYRIPKKRRSKKTENKIRTTVGETRAPESVRQATRVIADHVFQAGNRPVAETRPGRDLRSRRPLAGKPHPICQGLLNLRLTAIIRWCDRSSPLPSETASECAYSDPAR